MDPFIGQIILFAGTFAPRNWAFCDGQLLPISQNTALFSLLGTTYGGDGRVTFALPDLRGRVPIGPRTGAGLTNRSLGSRLGNESVSLTESQIPSHTHSVSGVVKASSDDGTTNNPAGAVFSVGKVPVDQSTNNDANIYNDKPTDVTMAADNLEITQNSVGGSLPHTNMQPSLALNYIIALIGVYPSRN